MDTEKAKQISDLYKKLKEAKRYYNYLSNQDSRIGSIDLYHNGRKEVIFIDRNDNIDLNLRLYLKQLYVDKIEELEEEIRKL